MWQPFSSDDCVVASASEKCWKRIFERFACPKARRIARTTLNISSPFLLFGALLEQANTFTEEFKDLPSTNTVASILVDMLPLAEMAQKQSVFCQASMIDEEKLFQVHLEKEELQRCSGLSVGCQWLFFLEHFIRCLGKFNLSQVSVWLHIVKMYSFG